MGDSPIVVGSGTAGLKRPAAAVVLQAAAPAPAAGGSTAAAAAKAPLSVRQAGIAAFHESGHRPSKRAKGFRDHLTDVVAAKEYRHAKMRAQSTADTVMAAPAPHLRQVGTSFASIPGPIDDLSAPHASYEQVDARLRDVTLRDRALNPSDRAEFYQRIAPQHFDEQFWANVVLHHDEDMPPGLRYHVLDPVCKIQDIEDVERGTGVEPVPELYNRKGDPLRGDFFGRVHNGY